MKCTYQIRMDRIANEEGNEVAVYGIEAWDCSDDIPTLQRAIADIFCDKQEAEEFAALCNRLELAPEQLDDVIADRLAMVG